jgi:hypothetical protein
MFSLEGIKDWVTIKSNSNTTKSYGSYAEDFKKFCHRNGVVHYPASPISIASYMIYLLESRGLARGTINNVAVSAIADLHRFDDQNNPTISGIIRAVKKSIGRATPPPQGEKPHNGRDS